MDALRVVFITVTRDEAGNMAKSLVENRLAACVNIIPKTESYYWWDDKINHDEESMLIAKTSVNKIEELIEYVEENHPYDIPEVISFQLSEGLPDYIDWVLRESTK